MLSASCTTDMCLLTTKHCLNSGKMPLIMSKNSIQGRFNQLTKKKNISSIPEPSTCRF